MTVTTEPRRLGWPRRPRHVARLRAAAAPALCLLAAACGGQQAADVTPASTVSPPVVTPSPAPSPSLRAQPRPTTAPDRPPSEPSVPPQPAAPDLGAATVSLTRVATLAAPTAMTTRPGDDALYLAERAGPVRVLRGGAVEPEPFVDLSDDTRTDGERGLLGIAFSPDGSRFYASFSDRAGDSRVDEWTVDGAGAVADSRRIVLGVEQPEYGNHKGGHIAFGPDGLLYLGLGDGGGQGDPDRNGQALDTLLGKLVRIDPQPRAGAGYGIPADNPFAGDPAARGEIWVYGVRNPWRFSFDRATGDLWIGDVGQSELEEINLLPAGQAGGADLGWSDAEGSQPFNGTTNGSVPPLTEYAHAGGRCSVTGGYVYRGSAIPALTGAYVYGDLCSGEVLAVAQDGGRVVGEAALGNVDSLVSFGEDAEGELYALSLGGEVLRFDPA